MILPNYIKLDSILYHSAQHLRHKKIDEKAMYNRNPYSQMLEAFNTIVASGYYQIAYNDDANLIKTNFDYTGTNTNVVLDFNKEYLKTLLNTDVKTDGGKPETLI